MRSVNFQIDFQKQLQKWEKIQNIIIVFENQWNQNKQTFS